MSEWKKVKLSELGEIVGGATPSTKREEYYNGKIPWLTPKDLSGYGSRYISKGERSITQEGLNSCSAKILPKDSVLFTSRAPIGYVAISENEICTNQGFKSIVPNQNTDSLFLFYLLKYNKERIEAMGSGTTFKEVSGSVMKNIEVDVPEYEEQKRISAILTSIDNLIEQNNQMNKNLEAQAQAIFKSWFVDFEPWGGVMPEDWHEEPLGSLCEIVTKGTTPTTLGKQFKDNGINFIKAESITDNYTFDKTKFSFIDDETNKLLQRSQIKEHDILFTIAGTLGRFAYATSDIVPANTNQAVAIIRINKDIINPLIVYSFFIGSWHADFYSKNIQQAVQANLSLTTIKNLTIPLLDSVFTNKYKEQVFAIFNTIFQNTNQSQTLAAIRDTLLPKLMSGEIDVKEEA